MPSMGCICGARIRLSAIPLPNGYHIRSEEQDFAIADALDVLYARGLPQEQFEDEMRLILWPVRGPSPYAVQCDECGRLAVFRHASDANVALWFTPEVPEGCIRTPLQSLYDSPE